MAVRAILVDTNAYTAFKRNVPEALEIIQQVPLISINSIILGELVGGFIFGSKETINRHELRQFFESSRVRMIAINEETSESYARVYYSLRRQGKPIPTNDMWIAATALQYELALFSYDNHFQSIDGLIVGGHLSNFIF